MSQDVIGTGIPGDDAFPPVETLTYEQARQELDETVRILEHGQMGLDESLRFWERGEALARRCEEHLSNARRTVEDALSRRAQSASEASTDSADDSDDVPF